MGGHSARPVVFLCVKREKKWELKSITKNFLITKQKSQHKVQLYNLAIYTNKGVPTMNHNQIISLIAVAFFGISTLFAQNATAKQSLANGIQAEQQGNNIAALTCYLQALTADKSLTEAKTRADTVLDEVAKGNFNTEFTSEKQNDNPVTLIKLREDWDKLLLAAAQEMATHSLEYAAELRIFDDITMCELTEENLKNNTVSLSASMPDFDFNFKKFQRRIAEATWSESRLKAGLKKFEQSKNWGEKINGFPDSYKNDTEGDNWLKQEIERDENTLERDEYKFLFSLCNDKGKIIATKNITFCYGNDFNIPSRYGKSLAYEGDMYLGISIIFPDIPISDADSEYFYLKAEYTGNKTEYKYTYPVYGGFTKTAKERPKRSVYIHTLDKDVMTGRKAVEYLNSHNDGTANTLKVAGQLTSEFTSALENHKGKITLDLSELNSDMLEENSKFNFDNLRDIENIVAITLPNEMVEFPYWSLNKIKVSVTDKNEAFTIVDNFVCSKDKSTLISLNPRNENATSVKIPEFITRIGRDAFRGCSSLTSVTIPNSVTKIGVDAFIVCSSLTSITIPSSVTEIGSDAFKSCPSLKTVNYRGTESQWKAIKIYFGNDELLKAKINFNYKGN